MDSAMIIEYAIYAFCTIGCGMTCHNLGRQQGIETTIEHLVDEGLLELEDD